MLFESLVVKVFVCLAFESIPKGGIENLIFDLCVYFELLFDLIQKLLGTIGFQSLQKLPNFLMILFQKRDRILVGAAICPASIRTAAAARRTFSRRWHQVASSG